MWDGTNENMQNVARNIIENYGKNVIIAETSYCFTTETGDGFKNAFVGDENLVEGYDASVEGQATIIRDICEAANDAGLIGVFYWGGTWVPVRNMIRMLLMLMKYLRLIKRNGKNSEVDGHVNVLETMMNFLRIMVVRNGIIRQCLTLMDIHYNR
mgnify:CR=1 FL=1